MMTVPVTTDQRIEEKTMTEVNVPLLRKVLEHIAEHPEEWDQHNFAKRTDCGTAYCVAGHAVTMTGHDVQWYQKYHWDRGLIATKLRDGRTIEDVAADLLGIPQWKGEEGHLFYDWNSLAALWRIAGELTDGEITPPADLFTPDLGRPGTCTHDLTT